MSNIVKSGKKILLVIVTVAMFITSFQLFSDVYATENNKIKDEDTYGESYEEDVAPSTQKTQIEKEDSDVIIKEPVVTKDTDKFDKNDEIINKRTENSKTYKLNSGQYVTEFYFDPIHKKEGKKYVEIDNTLEKKTGLLRSTSSTYVNKDGLYDFGVQDGTIEVSDSNEQMFTLVPEGNLNNYAVKENVILYSSILDNIDLEYRVESNHISQNLYINGKVDFNNYKFQLNCDGLTAEIDKEGTLVLKKNDEIVYSFLKPYLKDKEGTRNEETSYELKKNDSGYEVSIVFNNEWINQNDLVYPVALTSNVDVQTADVVDLTSSYIRSGRPEVTSQYSDLFVGYDDNYYGGQNSNIKIARTFIYFKMPNIGENQRIEKADLKLYKEQEIANNELNAINVYSTNSYVNPSTVNWNNQPTSKTKISTKEFSKPIGWKTFDITKHVEKLLNGEKRTLVLQVTDESSKYHCNVFNGESSSHMPKIEIYHCDDYDVDPALSQETFDNTLRVYAKDGQYFEAVSMDGIAKPNSNINFDLYAKVDDQKYSLIKTFHAKEKSSPNFIKPIYITDPITGVQTYKQEEVNYTTNYLKFGDIPKYDTFYEYRMNVEYNGKKSTKTLITDGFILYKVKMGDNLKKIASYYGLKTEDIIKDNNMKSSKIKEDDILFLRFAKDNAKIPKDVYKPPVKISKYQAKYVYRGPACYGSCSAADPVNTSIGNFYHESKDFTITDFDDLFLSRVYNSYGEDNSSIFGMNFSSNFEQYISYTKEDNMLFFRGDGKILEIPKKDGAYQPKLADKIKVKVNEKTVEIYDKTDDMTYIFDEYGMLSKIKTINGFVSQIHYDGYGMIDYIQIGKKKVTFEYNTYNLVKAIYLPNDTKIQYVYNADRQLSEFIDANGHKEKYTYDENGKIKNITDKNGAVLANNTYDENGIVLSQKDANGNLIEFSYEDGATKVTYNGKESETYSLNSEYKVSKISYSDGTSKSYTYDDAGYLTSETDEKGQKTTYTYDSNHNLTLQNNPDGTSEKYTYDSHGNVTSITNPDGTKETYEYDDNNNMTYKDTGEENGIHYVYDDKNLVIKETDALGVSKSYEYQDNQITKITHSNGLVETFTYDSMGNVTKESDNNGRSTTYVYDNNNQVIQKTDSYGHSEYYKYDGNGNVIESIDKLGSKITNTYDKNNNLIKTSQGGISTSKTYDFKNRLISETDEEGNKIQYVYDVKDQKIKEIDKYGNAKTNEYDAAGNLIKVTDEKGNTTTYEYEDDKVIKQTDELGLVTSYEYDQYNRIIKETKPNGKTVTTEYDSRGNVIKTVNERGLTNTKTYDQYDRLTKEVNEQGVVTTYTYDKYKQIIKKQEDDKVTTYEYDVYGNQIKETDTYGHAQTKEYDKLNRVVKETDQLGGTTTYKYDAQGNKTETIDANGHSEKKVYNTDSSLIKDIDALGNETVYSYDSAGRISKQTDAYGNVTSYTYDQYGNEATTAVNGKVLEETTYDKYGRTIKTVKLNDVIKTSYDVHDRVIKEENQTTGLVSEKEYDKFSNVIREFDNGGKEETYEYDEYNLVISSTDPYGRTATNTYDKYGQIIKKVNESNEVTTTQYDKYGNVVSETDHLGLKTEYQYDLLNRKTKEVINKEKTLTYTYDAKGQLLKTHDSSTDTEISSTYDAVGNELTSTDALGHKTTYGYDAKNRQIKTTDALGNSESKSYDIYDQVIKETDALGNIKQTKYDAFGNVVLEIDERGFTTEYKYNEYLQNIEVIDKKGNSSKFAYDEHGNLAKETNQRGYSTTYEYDLYGQKIKETDPNGNISTYEYDKLGNVIKETIPNKTTIHKYDEIGRLVSTKENDVYKVQNTYDDKNQIISSKNALNYVSEYTYDVYGNVLTESIDGHTTVNTYDLNQNLIKEVESNLKTTTHKYDALNQETETKINDVLQIKNEYDAVGNITYKYENGVQTKYTYDELNRQKDIYLNELNDRDKYIKVASYTYDESGNITLIKDAYGNTVKRSYDAFNQLVSETNGNGHTTKYAYDKVGNIAKVQDPKERVVDYSYDGNNNQIKKTINKKEAVYEYDENDHMISSKNEYGLKEKYKYDVDGNLISYTKNDGTTIKSTYDAEGNRLSEGDREFTYNAFNQILTAKYKGKTTTYEYDSLNQLSKVTDSKNQIVEYTYDVFGNKTSMKYKNNTITYTYNQFNKIDKVLQNGKQLAAYTYDARGNTSTFTRGNYTTSYEYDNLSRRTKYINKKGNDVLSTYEYAFDPNSNIISETINGKKNTYAYNENDELSSSSKYINNKVVETTYKYDAFGNKIERTNDETSKVYKYNDKNQLTSISDSSKGLTSIYYDKNGNMRDIYYAGGFIEHYTYDEYNQLTELKTNKISVYTYEYDAEGDRISQKAETKDRFEYGSKYEDTWYEDLQEMEFEDIKAMLDSMDSHAAFENLRKAIEHRGTCKGNFGQDNINDAEYGSPSRIENFTSEYLLDKSEENTQVLADNDKINIYGEERIATNQWSTYNYYITGLNESVYTVTETTSWSDKQTGIEYTDAGLTDDIDKGYAYNGEVKDVSGLIYLRARYYNPKIGQFVQIDPYEGEDENIASQNRYCYTINNPYKYVDPSGNFSILSIIKGITNTVKNVVDVITKNKKKDTEKKSKTKKKKAAKKTKPTKATGYVKPLKSSKAKKKNNISKKKVKAPDFSQNLRVGKNKASNKRVEKKQPQACKYAEKILDAMQFILDIIGFIPMFGDVCDGINAVISYLRGNYIDAIISVGCIVFTVFADTLLKPLKWAAKSATDAAKKIIKKIPDFSSKVCSFIKKIPSRLPKNLLDNDVIKTVRNGCQKFANYIYKLFQNPKVWNEKPFIRGTQIEKILSRTKYLLYEHVGKLAGGYFPVFDFIKGNKGISVKTLNMGVGKYVEPDEAIKQINKYVDDLINSSKKIDNLKRGRKDKKVQKWLKKAKKIKKKQLDLYVPKGTSYLINQSKIKSGENITVNILEYGR